MNLPLAAMNKSTGLNAQVDLLFCICLCVWRRSAANLTRKNNFRGRTAARCLRTEIQKDPQIQKQRVLRTHVQILIQSLEKIGQMQSNNHIQGL